MARERQPISINGFLIFLLVYCVASLFHYVHNAVFLDAYPNMPAWLSATKVIVAWFWVTTVGILGFLLVRIGWQIVGSIILGIYGALGLDGFAHYSLASVSAHTFIMNLTIWLEAITGVVVLIAAVMLMMKCLRERWVTA